MYLVSIIIPVYNVAQYIERCLLSVFAQIYSNIEIIIINDCTPDNSMEIIDDLFLKQNKPFKIKTLNHEKNRGLSAARNTGIDAANGDFVYFLDSDDEILPNTIEQLIADSDSFDVVIGGIITQDGKDFLKNKNLILNDTEIIDSFFRGNIYNAAWNKLVNRQFLLVNKLYFVEGLIHEDSLWTYQLVVCASKIKVLDIPTYIYNIRPNTLNTNFTLKNIKHYLYGFNIIQSHIKNNYNNNPLATNYLVIFMFNMAVASVKKCKCSYREYRSIISFDQSIKYNLTNVKSQIKVKYLFFQLPKMVQFMTLNIYRIIR
jgi:glycosyltransferase involved in cell wall biosynthesis